MTGESTSRSLFIMVCAWLLLAACATTGPPPSAERGAELEVINRSDAEMWIAVRGRVEATAPPRTRTIVRHLNPGTVDVLIQASPETRKAQSAKDVDLRLSRSVELVAGQRVVVDLYGPGAPAPLPAPLGNLRIQNTLSRDVQIWVDEVPSGTVLAGGERVIMDLVAGERRLRAADRKQKTVIQAKQTIAGTKTVVWKLAAAEAELRIINDTEESVRLMADDEDLGRLAAGRRRSITHLGVGKHLLVAVGEGTKHRFQKVLDLKPDFPAVWGLSSGSATLIVVNRTGEDIVAVPTGTFVTSAARTLNIPAGAEYRVDDVVPATIAINAVSAKTNTLYKMKTSLRPGQVYRWEITPAASGIRVINRTRSPLTLYLGRRQVGSMAPGTAKILTKLPKRAIKLQAYGADSQRYELSLLAAPREAATWTIRPETGALFVNNERPERLSVFVDALRVGTVGPNSGLMFTGIPVGSRLIEAVGEGTKATLRIETKIIAEAQTKVRFKDARGVITVVNNTGERLVAKGVLAAQRPVIDAGGRAHFQVRAGAHQLVVIGRGSRLVYRRRAEVTTEAKFVWTIEKPTGTVAITNQLPEKVALSLNGVPKGILSPGTTRVLGPLPAVRHRLVAQGMTSKRLWQTERRVRPDGAQYWALVDKPAKLVVKNRSQEPVELAIEGRPYGVVAAEGHRTFGNLAAGIRRVELSGMRSRVTQKFEVTLGPGRTDVVVAHAPFGTVLIDNMSGEGLVVRVGSETVGTIAAGREPTPIPISAGTRLVQVERVGSGHVSTYRLQVRPLRAIRLDVFAITARAAIKNSSKQALTIFANDRQLGVVAPGESLMIQDLKLGLTRFRAVASNGAVTHAERRALRDGELFPWELAPPPATPAAPPAAPTQRDVPKPSK